VIEAMLQSSNFLFRIDENRRSEIEAVRRGEPAFLLNVDHHAGRGVTRGAARAKLGTPAAIEKAARRMLDKPRAKEALDEFVGQWLRFDRLLTASKDRRKFRGSPRDSRCDDGRGSHICRDLVWNERNFMDLFTPTMAT